MLVLCPKALHEAPIAWTSDFDSWDLLYHGREYPAQQATRISYLLANTEECCKLQKGSHQRRVSLGSFICQTRYRWSDFKLSINKEAKNCWTWIRLSTSGQKFVTLNSLLYTAIPQTTACNCWFYPDSAISSFSIYRQCKIRLSICCLANEWLQWYAPQL